jgi:hypothetical protein
MKNPYAGLTVLWLTVALGSSMFLGQSKRPYDIVGVRFCPKTANLPPNYGSEFSQRSQQKLDKKYCRYERKLLKEVWEQKQFEASIPLPEASLIIRDIPATGNSAFWFLLSPIASGIAYLCWAKKSELNEQLAYDELEIYKTHVKSTGVSARNERDFKAQTINSNWDNQRVKSGFISVEAMQDKLKRQTELQDKTHDSALKQFATADSEMDKKIAENLRDKHKADKESQKVLGTKNKDEHITTSFSNNRELVNQLVDALKQHENEWLYKIIKIRKPLWIIGGQGAGKSTLAASIILLRHYLFGWELVEIIDAHAQKNCTKAWKHLMELGNNPPAVVGANNDYESINESFTGIIDRWALRSEDDTPTQSLVDEYTNLSDAEACKESAGKFVKHSLSDIRKAAEYWVFIAHFFTATATGKSEGTHKARVNQTIQIEKYSADGETPLSNATVNGLVDSKGKLIENMEVTIPGWLRPESIFRHFNGQPIQIED